MLVIRHCNVQQQTPRVLAQPTTANTISETLAAFDVTCHSQSKLSLAFLTPTLNIQATSIDSSFVICSIFTS